MLYLPMEDIVEAKAFAYLAKDTIFRDREHRFAVEVVELIIQMTDHLTEEWRLVP